MRRLSRVGCALTVAMSFVAAAATAADMVEEYVSVPLPPGFRVVSSELDGPVFADSHGHTLYTWPFKRMRNGYSGEAKGKPGCYGEVRTETAGLMSPYPPGILLPELDKRPSCTTLWAPVVASDDAKTVGKWTVIARKDGVKQWAYDEQPLYTSSYDREVGDVMGGRTREGGIDIPAGDDSPATRVPAGPPMKIPPGFAVKTTTAGRLLTTKKG